MPRVLRFELEAADDDLWWRVGRLADEWIPGLTYTDNGNLLGKLRDHFRSLLK